MRASQETTDSWLTWNLSSNHIGGCQGFYCSILAEGRITEAAFYPPSHFQLYCTNYAALRLIGAYIEFQIDGRIQSIFFVIKIVINYWAL